MKRLVRAAESDYIKIGNKIYPKDASAFGYASADEVSRATTKKYNEEKEAERAEIERQRKIKEGKVNYEKTFVGVNPEDPEEDQFNQMFNNCVPDSGKCDNLGAELIRAMMRILYRDYNDGDVFYSGYGVETCGSPAAFIIDNTEGSKISSLFDNIVENELTEESYTQQLNEITGELITYLRDEHQEVFGEDTEDSLDYDSYTLSEIVEQSHNHEFDADLPENIEDEGIFMDFLDDLCNQYGGSVHQWARDAFTIVNLDKDELEEWERNYDREVNRFIEENEEYNDEEDEE